MQVKGTVDSVYSKTKSTRSGDKTIYYMSVDGTEVNLGFKPTHSEGEYVALEVEEKWGELQIVGKAGSKKPAPAAPKSTGYTGSKGGFNKGTFPVEPTDSQVSIIRQSSLNRAVETVNDMVTNGTWACDDDEAYLSKVFELAYLYTDFGTGQREVKMKENAAIKRAALEAVNG